MCVCVRERERGAAPGPGEAERREAVVRAGEEVLPDLACAWDAVAEEEMGAKVRSRAGDAVREPPVQAARVSYVYSIAYGRPKGPQTRVLRRTPTAYRGQHRQHI